MRRRTLTRRFSCLSGRCPNLRQRSGSLLSLCCTAS
jgi:hypothetical protein